MRKSNTHPEKSRQQRIDELDSDELRCAVKECGSITGLSKFMGFSAAFNVFLKTRMENESIDYSHFRVYRSRPLEEILVKGTIIRSVNLKQRLLSAGVLENVCNICGMGPEYNDEKLVLQLDHVDGDNDNQELSNLRILCPNCHSQTETYSGKNKKLRKNARLDKRPDLVFHRGKRYIHTVTPRSVTEINTCVDCDSPIDKAATRCVPCHCKSTRKVERPPLEDLEKEIEESSYVAVGKKYGVSDSAIRKWVGRKKITKKQN